MSTMVPMYGFGGGGGAVASLTVNAPAGAVVTVSKDGKSKTKTAGADGVVVFKGLETGDWTCNMVSADGTQVMQPKVYHITAGYEISLTFFAATIHITYPAGSTCTATDGVTTLTAPDTSGTWDCVVHNAGTWTVTASGYIPISVSVQTNGKTISADLKTIYLFKDGNQYTDVTGGWQNAIVNVGNYKNSGNATIGDVINVAATSGAQAACTVNKIDLTKYKSIKFTRTKKGGASSAFSYLVVAPVSSGDRDKIRVAESYKSPLDISSISGNYYIMLVAFHNRNDDFNNIYLSI